MLDQFKSLLCKFVQNSGILVTLMSMLCSSQNLSTLAARRKQMKPCVMYKGVHGLADFPKTHNGQPLPSTKLQFPYTFSVLMLQSIKYTLFFFFPDSVEIWISLLLMWLWQIIAILKLLF